MKKIKCNSINYRKGFIEVSGGIHKECINLELWRIHPDTDISSTMAFDEVPDCSFTSNTELELSLSEAEKLIDLLKTAISNVRGQRQ